MKIHDVQIQNWHPNGFWEDVEEKPDEELIEAKISMRLTSHEYHELLDRGKDGSLNLKTASRER